MSNRSNNLTRARALGLLIRLRGQRLPADLPFSGCSPYVEALCAELEAGFITAKLLSTGTFTTEKGPSDVAVQGQPIAPATSLWFHQDMPWMR